MTFLQIIGFGLAVIAAVLIVSFFSHKDDYDQEGY
jgi:hypothetical protein